MHARTAETRLFNSPLPSVQAWEGSYYEHIMSYNHQPSIFVLHRCMILNASVAHLAASELTILYFCKVSLFPAEARFFKHLDGKGFINYMLRFN